jgi:hypothetical protein
MNDRADPWVATHGSSQQAATRLGERRPSNLGRYQCGKRMASHQTNFSNSF